LKDKLPLLDKGESKQRLQHHLFIIVGGELENRLDRGEREPPILWCHQTGHSLCSPCREEKAGGWEQFKNDGKIGRRGGPILVPPPPPPNPPRKKEAEKKVIMGGETPHMDPSGRTGEVLGGGVPGEGIA